MRRVEAIVNLSCGSIDSPVGKLKLIASDKGMVAILWEHGAVGAANGRNPISIVVPCHRVIRSSGKLTGFAGGLGAKVYLLELEGPTELLDG